MPPKNRRMSLRFVFRDGIRYLCRHPSAPSPLFPEKRKPASRPEVLRFADPIRNGLPSPAPSAGAYPPRPNPVVAPIPTSSTLFYYGKTRKTRHPLHGHAARPRSECRRYPQVAHRPRFPGRPRLAATLTLIQEIREAGVPLLLALSDAAVYPSSAGKMNETAAIGGRTREGLEASILQMAILGAARGLTGDAVRTMLIRHAPTLGGQCTDWCEALLNGEPVKVANPTARGVFVHPLDVAGCALMLGAEAFRRWRRRPG